MATPSDTSRSIAAAVSAALKEAGIAQRDAAARSGIPLTTLSRRLTGNSPFTVTELAILADLCGLTVADFIPADAA